MGRNSSSDNNFNLRYSLNDISGVFAIITREGLIFLLNKIYDFLCL